MGALLQIQLVHQTILRGFLRSCLSSSRHVRFDLLSPLQPHIGRVLTLATPNRILSGGEVVSPPQTTLLKLLDSYLQAFLNPSTRPQVFPRRLEQDLGFILSELFHAFSAFIQNTIRQSLGKSSAESAFTNASEGKPEEISPLALDASGVLDLHMPAVCAALVLVVQCAISLLLSEDLETTTQSKPELEDDNESDSAWVNLKHFLLNNTAPQGKNVIIETLIGEALPPVLSLTFLRRWQKLTAVG